MNANEPSRNAPELGGETLQGRADIELAVFLEASVSAGASSQDVAAMVAAAFMGIDQVLTPIIGQRGVAALYRRTLHLAGKAKPWWPRDAEGESATLDVAPLLAQLSRQTAAEAASTGLQLLQTFLGLLASLIGHPLTERLLRPVWATFSGGPSAMDPKP